MGTSRFHWHRSKGPTGLHLKYSGKNGSWVLPILHSSHYTINNFPTLVATSCLGLRYGNLKIDKGDLIDFLERAHAEVQASFIMLGVSRVPSISFRCKSNTSRAPAPRTLLWSGRLPRSSPRSGATSTKYYMRRTHYDPDHLDHLQYRYVIEIIYRWEI